MAVFFRKDKFMCGIVGTVGIKNNERLKVMNQIQFHRGPDSEGMYWNEKEKVGLAMRRLEIVDITMGSQPMFNENKDIVIVFNGEIFNAPELRKKLMLKGHSFETLNSDTEVLVHLYEEIGQDMLNELNGMFAFLIWDNNKKILFGARDYAGIKPLYYFKEKDTLLAASELKSIISGGGINKELDMQSISDYLSLQFIPSPRTIYKDIKKLGAGEAFIYNVYENSFYVYRYWNVKNCIADRYMYYDEAVWMIRKKMTIAVERWKMSDVQTSCLLSGGIDSASLVAMLSSEGNIINTFTLGFENECDVDERRLAALVANRYHTHHTEIILKEDDLLSDLNEMIYALDEPYAGGIPSWYVYKMIGKQYKVAFTGVGGDELFGNYGKWIRYESRKNRFGAYRWEYKKGVSVMNFIRYPYGSIYHKYMPDNIKKKIFIHAFTDVDYLYEMMIKENKTKSWKNTIPCIDFKMQLPDEFLFMTDRFSMAHSVEARTPFLDKEFIQTVFGILPEIRTSSQSLKGLYIDAVKDLLPNEIINAPKKGFIIPYEHWLKGKLKNLVEYYFSVDFVKRQGIFNRNLKDVLLQPFMKGESQYTPYIWTILMFQLWYDRCVGITI